MIPVFILSAVFQSTDPASALGLPMGFYTSGDTPCEAGAPNFDNLIQLSPGGMQDFATGWDIVSVQPMGADSFLVKERFYGNDVDERGEVAEAVSESIYTKLSSASFTASDVARHTTDTVQDGPVFRFCDQSRLPRDPWQW